MKTGINMCALAFAVAALPASATEYFKEVKLTYVSSQGNRPTSPMTQNHDFINFVVGPTWNLSGGTGGGTCAEAAAVIPADNPTMRAIALTAIAKGATVLASVDSTLPMVGPYCQLSALSIKDD